MTGPTPPRWERVLGRIWKLYPQVFRAKHERAMRSAFADRLAEAKSRSHFAVMVLWARECSAAAWHAVALRLTTPAARTGARRHGRLAFLLQDARFAFRSFRRSPGFAGIVIVTLALGIGANTAIFSVVKGVLLAPLPYEQSDRLVSVWGRFLPESGFDFPTFPLSIPEYVDYRDQNSAMESVAMYRRSAVVLTGLENGAERVPVSVTTANLFRVLRAQPMLGRTLVEDDNLPGAPGVVVLGFDAWQTRFGGDPEIVGKTIYVDRIDPVEVVGVMPRGFAFPSRDISMWFPRTLDPANPGNRQSHSMRALGRLSRNATLEQARAEMATMMEGWKEEFPTIHTGHFLFLRPLLDDFVGNVKTPLFLLLAAVGAVLLIVCANVANVLLARSETRAKEIAIRTAMGAGRRRVVTQLLTESLILSGLGGLLGVALASQAVRILLTMNADNIPRSQNIGLDGPVLLFGAGLTVSVGLIFGIVPALQRTGNDLQTTLREGGRSLSATRSALSARAVLVTAELALSLVLVVGAALMVRSFASMTQVDLGFNPEGVLLSTVRVPPNVYTEPEQPAQFYDELLERIRAIPGVHAAAGASSLALAGGAPVADFEIASRPPQEQGDLRWNASSIFVVPGFFDTMGMRVLRGQTFSEQDHVASPPVVVINEQMAREFFGGEDPLGQQLRVSGSNDYEWMTIIGIVESVRGNGLGTLIEEPDGAYYMLWSQAPRTWGSPIYRMIITVRAERDAALLARPVAAAVQEMDADLPVYGVGTMDGVVSDALAQPRFTMVLLAVFGGLALVLAAVGVYGVMSYTVARRDREIGIRMALGADRSSVTSLVLKQGMTPAAIGIMIGLLAAFGGSKMMTSMLYGVSPTDPTTFGLVASLLSVVALAACLIPARRATRIDPMVTMRSE